MSLDVLDLIRPLLFLSYPLPSPPTTSRIPPMFSLSTLYGKGPLDAVFVLSYAVLFTLLRSFFMQCVFAPFARQWVASSGKSDKEKALEEQRRQNGVVVGKGGVGLGVNGVVGAKASEGVRLEEERLSEREKKRREHVVTRFAEQGWPFAYYSASFALGCYILSLAPTSPFSPHHLWGSYPNTPLPGLIKFYYLAQLGFYPHQCVILNLEARRKDHWQMLSHHFITIALVAGSYAGNFTRVGCLVLVLMDFCDICLPLAKMTRYLTLPRTTDFLFVIFLLSWLFTRQFGFGYVLYSVMFQLRPLIPPVWDPSKGMYATENVILGFKILLSVIQAMSCVWLWMACRVAYKVVRGEGAEDSRSDDGDLDDIPETPQDDSEDTADSPPPSTSTISDGIFVDKDGKESTAGGGACDVEVIPNGNGKSNDADAEKLRKRR